MIEAFRAILSRFGRMPRSGWNLTHNTFCDKFNVQTPLTIFKKTAQATLVNNKGNKCTNREYNEVSVKRHKPSNTYLDEKKLQESQYYIEVKQKFLECYKKIEKIEIVEVERTPKVPNEKINQMALQATIRTVNEFVRNENLTDIKAIIKTLQSAQITYHKMTFKKKIKSTWKKNIEEKINNWQTMTNQLKDAKKFTKLEKKTKRNAV